MNPSIQLKKAIPLFIVALACFAVSPISRAVSPAPDGGYPGANTAEGDDALFSLTTGSNNAATGYNALYSNRSGAYNTASGDFALYATPLVWATPPPAAAPSGAIPPEPAIQQPAPMRLS